MNAFSVDFNEIQQKLGVRSLYRHHEVTFKGCIVTDSEEDMGDIYIRLFNHSDLSQLSVYLVLAERNMRGGRAWRIAANRPRTPLAMPEEFSYEMDQL